MRSPRLWLVLLLMSLTSLVLHVRGDVDRILPSRPLSELPTTVGLRSSVDIPIDPEQLEVLGNGIFLYRQYEMPVNVAVKSLGDHAQISLYIAYFPTQRSGQSIHSPQNCLPGAGWTFASSGVAGFTDAAGKRYSVAEHLITNGSATDEALYWYQLHGRSVASDYQAKLDTLADSIRLGRTDEALVRIITPVIPGEDRLQAHNRAIAFATQIAPLLPQFIPN